MAYLYWIGAFAVIAPLILVLPLLSRNRTYRIATLFAGMNAGIVTFAHFINLLRWGAGPASADQFHGYFTRSLPSLYIASLVIGSTAVSRYLHASTRAGILFSTFGSLLGVYFLVIIIARLLVIFSITIKEGFPSPELLSEIVEYFLEVLAYPDLSFVVWVFVPALIALNGTAAAMRISDDAEAPKDEETE
jgi:hypothetical protein